MPQPRIVKVQVLTRLFYSDGKVIAQQTVPTAVLPAVGEGENAAVQRTLRLHCATVEQEFKANGSRGIRTRSDTSRKLIKEQNQRRSRKPVPLENKDEHQPGPIGTEPRA